MMVYAECGDLTVFCVFIVLWEHGPGQWARTAVSMATRSSVPGLLSKRNFNKEAYKLILCFVGTGKILQANICQFVL